MTIAESPNGQRNDHYTLSLFCSEKTLSATKSELGYICFLIG